MSILGGINSGGAGGGGSIATGGGVVGADIVEANLGPTGPYSTNAILNASQTGAIIHSLNYNGSQEVNVIRNDGVGLYIGDSTIGLQDTAVIGSTVAIYGAGQNAEVQCTSGGTTNIYGGAAVGIAVGPVAGAVTVQATSTFKQPLQVGPSGPYASNALINVQATGNVMGYRNAANTGDRNIIALDGADSLKFGDFTAGVNTNVYGGTQIVIGNSAINAFIANGTSVSIGGASLNIAPAITAQAAATVQGALTVQSQAYAAQRVSSDFPTSATGVATAPSQLLIPFSGSQNVAFDANLFIQEAGAGGMRPAIAAPSGATVIAGFQGSGAQDVLSVTSSSLTATAVGTGVYAATVGKTEQVSVIGSISGSVGCTGPVMITMEPWVSAHTGTIKQGSTVLLRPST